MVIDEHARSATPVSPAIPMVEKRVIRIALNLSPNPERRDDLPLSFRDGTINFQPVTREAARRGESPRRGRLVRRHCVLRTSESCGSLLTSGFANATDGLLRLAKQAPLACDSPRRSASLPLEMNHHRESNPRSGRYRRLGAIAAGRTHVVPMRLLRGACGAHIEAPPERGGPAD